MDNYTGPYWSDGKLQPSVEFGQTPPLSSLDVESRLHDSAYAHYEDLQHRMAADSIYESRVEKLGGFAKFAGEAVLYGNQTLRAGGNLLEYSKYGLVGLVVGSLINDYNLFDYMNNSERYKKEVLAYYATDPGWAVKGETPEPERANDKIYMHRRFAVGENSGPRFSSDGSRVTEPPKRGVGFTTLSRTRPVFYNPYNEFPQVGGRRRKKRVKYD